MTRVEKIERDIETLGSDELARFRAWFAAFDGENWDRQIEADAISGQLDRFSQDALKEHRAGRTKLL